MLLLQSSMLLLLQSSPFKVFPITSRTFICPSDGEAVGESRTKNVTFILAFPIRMARKKIASRSNGKMRGRSNGKMRGRSNGKMRGRSNGKSDAVVT